MEILYIQLSDVAYISISQKLTHDWFCAPGSHIKYIFYVSAVVLRGGPTRLILLSVPGVPGAHELTRVPCVSVDGRQHLITADTSTHALSCCQSLTGIESRAFDLNLIVTYTRSQGMLKPAGFLSLTSMQDSSRAYQSLL